MAIMPDPDHILLAYRDDDFYKGWHIPGSILRYGDSILKAQNRIALGELGLTVSRVRFSTYFY
ncbi:MAG: hypothetical protein AAB795_02465, partial [Patescibacteria group bacterium]